MRSEYEFPALPYSPLSTELGNYPLAGLADLKQELLAKGGPVFDFSIGDPVEPTPPFIREAVASAIGAVSQYPTSSGPIALRSAIADWVERRFGVMVDPKTQVIPTSGSKEAIFHLPFGVIQPDGPQSAALWGDPGYPGYGRGALLAGGVSDPVTLGPQNGWKLDLEAVEPGRLQRAAIAWLNYPHNPTGATVDLQYYADQLAMARQHGIWLASDECYADIYPPGDGLPPSLLQATGGDFTGVVVAFSLSKRSGMTGYRCGALVGDPDLMESQKHLRANFGTANPQFIQYGTADAWADDDHPAERRGIFEAKRAVLLPFLEVAGIEVSASNATFYLWLRAPGGDDLAYVEALLQEGVIATPGRSFGAAGKGWMRLALVPSESDCRAAVAAWSAAIERGDLPGHH